MKKMIGLTFSLFLLLTASAHAQDSATFFSRPLYWVWITHWPSDRLSPQSLSEEVKVPGAKLEIFIADPKSQHHCPDQENATGEALFSTSSFSIKTSGNMTKNTPKSSYRVKFEEGKFAGMKALNLKSMWNDVSQMREALAWDLFAKAKVVAPRHTYAKVCFNNRYMGLYSVIENVDKNFLQDRFPQKAKGNLYQVNYSVQDLGPANLGYRRDHSGNDQGAQYYKRQNISERTYELKTNVDDFLLASYDDLASFIRILNRHGDPSSFVSDMEATFDVKAYLRWAAINNLLGAWDNYWQTASNFTLYNQGQERSENFMKHPYFVWIPWDYDNTFGITYTDKNWARVSLVDWEKENSEHHLPLISELLKEKKFMTYYLDYVEFLITGPLAPAQVLSKIQKIWSNIAESVYLESDTPYGASHTFRQFTNDEVYQAAVSMRALKKNNAYLPGIIPFLAERLRFAQIELRELRKRYP